MFFNVKNMDILINYSRYIKEVFLMYYYGNNGYYGTPGYNQAPCYGPTYGYTQGYGIGSAIWIVLFILLIIIIGAGWSWNNNN